jgi:hypothetical protein
MRSKWIAGGAFLAVTGFLATSTQPVHAAPVRSTNAASLNGHEVRPDFIGGYTAEEHVMIAYEGAVAGTEAGPAGAAVGAAVMAAGYALLHVTDLQATPIVVPPGADAARVRKMSDARLDRPGAGF